MCHTLRNELVEDGVGARRWARVGEGNADGLGCQECVRHVYVGCVILRSSQLGRLPRVVVEAAVVGLDDCLQGQAYASARGPSALATLKACL